MTVECKTNQPALYHISVQGNLDEQWSDWFDGFTIAQQADDETCLKGVVVDQAALYGLLGKIWDLGLPLLSVRRVSTEREQEGIRKNV